MWVLISEGGHESMGAFKFDVLPMVGDSLSFSSGVIYRVRERGHICSSKKDQGGFLIVEEIEGKQIAPSARYDFVSELK